jgi:ubiquinone/menaquinone biosynthesis C-methylase UbiE
MADGMIERQLEPEAMDTAEEAREYDAMDHTAVNARFVADLVAVRQLGRLDLRRRFVIDVGTGTARIPIEFCRVQPEGRVVAVDLAGEMLKVARRNLSSAGLTGRVALQVARVTALPFRDGCSPMVVSNSLIHHLPDPAAAFKELARVTAIGGILFVRDLFRPPSQPEVDRLVNTHAAGATPHQRQLLADSLRAALTLEGVRDAVGGLPLSDVSLLATSDRHWTLTAVRADAAG